MPGEAISSPVRFTAREPKRVGLAVATPRDCWLYLSHLGHTGWRALVDGRDEPIFPANLIGRAVRLAAGRHGVVFEYRCEPFPAAAS